MSSIKSHILSFPFLFFFPLSESELLLGESELSEEEGSSSELLSESFPEVFEESELVAGVSDLFLNKKL